MQEKMLLFHLIQMFHHIAQVRRFSRSCELKDLIRAPIELNLHKGGPNVWGIDKNSVSRLDLSYE